jgi:hypothetical protein
MKRGDLVRLTVDQFQGQMVIYVASIPQSTQWLFDDGTLALVLDEYFGPEVGGERKFKILVDGRTGWVYESDCEVIDETG